MMLKIFEDVEELCAHETIFQPLPLNGLMFEVSRSFCATCQILSDPYVNQIIKSLTSRLLGFMFFIGLAGHDATSS